MDGNTAKVTSIWDIAGRVLQWALDEPLIAAGGIIVAIPIALGIWLIFRYLTVRVESHASRAPSAEIAEMNSAEVTAPPLIVAIESFPRRPVSGEPPPDRSLSLLEFFDGRSVKDVALWSDPIWSSLRTLFADILRTGRPVHLRLDAHATIAFACGILFDVKSGLGLEIEQRIDGATETWQPTADREARALPSLTISGDDIVAGGPDIAIGLSITRSVMAHVRAYVGRCLPQVGKVIALIPEGGPGQRMVIDGDHAARLADAIANEINDLRGHMGGAGRIHIFAACPNSVMVALGRRSRVFGAVRLYEFDFEQAGDGSYMPSLDFGSGT